MFDVDWVDPTRETVGQRKSRKDQQSNGFSRSSSIRSSRSSDSISNPQKPSLLRLFSSKKPDTGRAASNSKLAFQGNESNHKSSKRMSTYTVTSDTSIQEMPKLTVAASRRSANANDFFAGPPYNAGSDRSDPSDVSVFSGWTGRTATTESSWGSVSSPSSTSKGQTHIVQKLSRNSRVTRSTEVTVSSNESICAAEKTSTIVHISAEGTMPVHLHDSPFQRSPSTPISPRSPAPLTFEFPIPKSSSSDEASPAAPENKDLRQSIGWPMTTRRRADAWQPPEAWECQSDGNIPRPPQPGAVSGSTRRSREKKASPPSSEFLHVQKSIRKMDAASPKIVLERLREEWDGVADASVYRELELEKQLWMLSTLRSLSKKQDAVAQSTLVPSTPGTKVLSLYENHASASFLSVLSPAPEVHHISPTPLSPKSYHNIYPLTIPGPTPHVPYASNIFTSIHAFSLPALLPASSLPTILKECHRTLALPSPTLPPPTLHLTILDPGPLPSTLGPRLRAWLDTHLILNLERQFRCINPSRLFPIWLSDARLRAQGSTITSVRFLASPGDQSFVIVDHGEQRRRDDTRAELKSVLGRMLWREMWGAYVEGRSWWWEDVGIVEECERMGTCWEYAVIEAVKEV